MKNGIFLFAICTFGTCYSQQSNNQISLYFDFGKWTLSDAEQQKLDQFLTKKNSTIIFTSLEAHTDTVGSEEFNKNLALKRCNTIKSILNQGIMNAPIIIGESEAQKSNNYVPSDFRRVTIHYTLKKFPETPIKTTPKEEVITTVVPVENNHKSISESVESFLDDSESNTLQYDLSILFYNNSAQPLPESSRELEELYSIMRTNEELEIIIHGHVCCTDSYEVSLKRAQAVYFYLKDRKIDVLRMKYVGHSNTKPKVYPEITEEDMKQNRRVSIEFLK